MATVLKTVGYLVSTLSVMLLAIPAWKNASQSTPMMLALLAGMATSITGMLLRLCSHLTEQRQKKRQQAELDAVADTASRPTRAA